MVSHVYVIVAMSSSVSPMDQKDGYGCIYFCRLCLHKLTTAWRNIYGRGGARLMWVNVVCMYEKKYR